jgi:hypothetical protein
MTITVISRVRTPNSAAASPGKNSWPIASRTAACRETTGTFATVCKTNRNQTEYKRAKGSGRQRGTVSEVSRSKPRSRIRWARPQRMRAKARLTVQLGRHRCAFSLTKQAGKTAGSCSEQMSGWSGRLRVGMASFLTRSGMRCKTGCTRRWCTWFAS